MRWPSSRDVARTLLLWLFSVVSVCAQHTVEVRSPAAKLIDTLPGRIVTTSVVVANRGAAADEFVERMVLPAGCQRVAPAEVPFQMEPGGQTVRVLAVQVPADTAVGRLDVRYIVQGRRDPSATGSLDFSIQVLPVDGLELAVDPRTDPVMAGDNYAVKLHVTNHGNSRLPVQLTWHSTLNYRISGGESTFVLNSGETREISYRVETDKQLSQRASHALIFEAKAVGASGKELKANHAAVAEIIPLVSGDRDPFHRIPMQLKLTALLENDHSAQFQTELSGAGTLDEEGKRRIDFLFRGPDVQNSSLFGERDEYGLSYHDEHWDVNLGDRVYELSPLTEKLGFGRGAGVNWHSGATAVGAFYMTTLHRAKNTEEIGAFVREQLGGGFSMQANYLRKWGGSDAFDAHTLPQSIFSFETHYTRGKEMDLRIEPGVSYSDSGKTDFAFRTEARGVLFGKVNYAVEHVNAGPDFHGYENDTRTTYATVDVPVTKKFRVHASLNDYAGNLDLNPERSSVVNREHSWSAGANYALTKQTDLSLDWQHTKRQDILLPAAYDFTEDSARLGVGHNFGKIQMQSFLDIGTLENRLTQHNGPFERYSAFLSYQPTARQSYSIFGSYGPSAFTGAADESLNAGVSARWQLKDNITANVSYAHNQYNSEDGHQQDQALASLRYQFANRNEINITGRWAKTSGEERDEQALMVSISRPFNVAVSRKTSIGGLHGRITEGGVGVARVVVMAGSVYAVTDSAGEFEFPALKPGTCELRVVGDSLGQAMVMSTPLPMKVKIRSAETTQVTLQAVKAATVAVQLKVMDFGPGDTFKFRGGLEGGTVELTDGHDVLPAQTDRLGHVSFERVPCGAWTVRVRDERIPAHHFIEQPEQPITLASGETREVEVRILPKKRTIQMIDRGSVH